MTSKTTFSYRDIIKRAYHITKQHKFLWFFGFFAAFLGVGGELEPLFQNYYGITDTSAGVFGLQSIYKQGVLFVLIDNIKTFFINYPIQGFFFLLMILVVGFVFLWLAIISIIALFDAAYKISRRKEVSYSEAYRIGNKYFGSILLINLVLKGLLYFLFIVVGATLLSWFLVQSNVWGALLFVIFFFLVLVPLAIVISFIVRYATGYIVIKGKKVSEAVRLGWELFWKNWLISIEMAVIILALGVLAGLVIALALGLISVPFILLGIAALFFGLKTGVAVVVVVATVAWFLVAAVIGSIYVAFQYTAWTLLFLELVGDKAQSKLVRLFGKIGIGR